MRSLIHNAILLKILECIERYLGYTISAVPLTPVEQRLMYTGIQRREQGWTLLYPLNLPISDATLCHELMHVSLYIEGWPEYFLDLTIQRGSAEQTIFAILLSLTQHTTIWERMSYLGFDNVDPQETRETSTVLVPQLVKGTLYSNCPPPLRQDLIAACLLQVILSPMPRSLRREAVKAAQRKFPSSVEKAKAVQRVFDNEQPLDPRSSLEVLEKSLVILSLPKEIQRHEFPKEADPNFYAHLLKSLQALDRS